MHPFLSQLAHKLNEQPLALDDESVDSLLDILYSHFAESNRFNNATIKNGFATIRAMCSSMTLRELDDLIETVCTICQEHERLAFEEGVKIGAAIIGELQK